jgi:hypothetical protein
MPRASLIVFGPADGFRAFRLPEVEELADDSLAISSSELVLADAAMALLITRPPGSTAAAPAVRIGMYRQVYESGMKRPGSAFGAAFDFHGELPDAVKIIVVLRQLLILLEQNCVTSRRFQTLDDFTAFLQNTLAKSADLIIRDVVRGPPAGPSPILTATAVQATYGFASDGATHDLDAARLLRWFATDPGAVQCSRLLIYSSTGADVNSLVKPLPSRDELIKEALERLSTEILKARATATDATEKQLATLAELSQVKAENERLTGDYNALRTKLMREPPNGPATTSPPARATLNAQDVALMREAVASGLRDVLTRTGGRERERDTQSSSRRYGRGPLGLPRRSWLSIAAIGLAFLIGVASVALYDLTGKPSGITQTASPPEPPDSSDATRRASPPPPETNDVSSTSPEQPTPRS